MQRVFHVRFEPTGPVQRVVATLSPADGEYQVHNFVHDGKTGKLVFMQRDPTISYFKKYITKEDVDQFFSANVMPLIGLGDARMTTPAQFGFVGEEAKEKDASAK